MNTSIYWNWTTTQCSSSKRKSEMSWNTKLHGASKHFQCTPTYLQRNLNSIAQKEYQKWEKKVTWLQTALACFKSSSHGHSDQKFSKSSYRKPHIRTTIRNSEKNGKVLTSTRGPSNEITESKLIEAEGTSKRSFNQRQPNKKTIFDYLLGIYSSMQSCCIRDRLHPVLENWRHIRKWAYLEPDFEVESCAGVASGVQEAKSNATIDAAAEKDGNSEALVGHTAWEIGPEIGIEALWRVRHLGHHSGRGRVGHREGSEQSSTGGVPGLKDVGFNKS